MSINQSLASHLLHDSRVVQYVGGRVYHMVAPPNTPTPYITYQRITEGRERHMTAVAGLVETEFDVNCWSKSSNEASELADAVRRSLDHKYNSTLGRAPYKDTLAAAFLDNVFDDYEAPSDSSERGIFRVLQSWIVWHTESIPELAI